jgi:hypothetical protein
MTTIKRIIVDEEFTVDGQLPDEIVVEGPDGKTQTYATRETFLDQVEQRLVADGGTDE